MGSESTGAVQVPRYENDILCAILQVCDVIFVKLIVINDQNFVFELIFYLTHDQNMIQNYLISQFAHPKIVFISGFINIEVL